MDEIKQILKKVRWGDYQKEDGSWSRGVANQDEIAALIASYAEKEHAIGVGIGLARAKTSVTVMMNTGQTFMEDLRAGLNREIKWWDENMFKPEVEPK